MSEQLKPSGNESLQPKNSAEAREQLDGIGEKLRNSAEKSREKEDSNKEKLEARKSIDTLAISGKEKAPSGSEQKQQRQAVSSAHKRQTYEATMKRVEAQLPNYQRTFSRFVNNPRVDRVSNVVGRTIARPSGIVGGGLFAVVGLLVLTYYANEIGFALSGTEFILLLVAGWAIGIVLDLVLTTVRRIFR